MHADDRACRAERFKDLYMGDLDEGTDDEVVARALLLGVTFKKYASDPIIWEAVVPPHMNVWSKYAHSKSAAARLLLTDKRLWPYFKRAP
jgi:hypothetical protein